MLMFEWGNYDPTFIKYIIGDETWIYEFGMLTKEKASDWRAANEPRPKNVKLNQKPRFCSLFSLIIKVFHIVDLFQNVLFTNYVSFVWSLSPKETRFIEKQFVDFACNHYPWFFCKKKRINIAPQVPYSSDMLPHDFLMFSRLKSFGDVELAMWSETQLATMRIMGHNEGVRKEGLGS